MGQNKLIVARPRELQREIRHGFSNCLRLSKGTFVVQGPSASNANPASLPWTIAFLGQNDERQNRVEISDFNENSDCYAFLEMKNDSMESLRSKRGQGNKYNIQNSSAQKP